MKKIFITLSIFIYGCGTLSSINEPSKTIRNTKCENIRSFQVIQVLDDFVLANSCEDNNNRYCYGHVVYIQKEKGNIYYDDQKIILQSGECPIYVGTYQYVAKSGISKTVPKVRIVDSRVPNPEYNEWLKNKKK
jgi:hypothetical protein